MFDGLRKVTQTLGLDQINRRIGDLNTSRAGLRQRLGDLHAEIANGSPQSELVTTQRQVVRELREVDGEVQDLRARRRPMVEPATVPDCVPDCIAGVPVPTEVMEINRALDAARASRTKLLAEFQSSTAEPKARVQIARREKIAALEGDIQALRVRREAALMPYNAAVHAAMQPMLAEAAAKVLAAEALFAEAMHVFRACAVAAPPIPGQGQTLSWVLGVDDRGIRHAATHCRPIVEVAA